MWKTAGLGRRITGAGWPDFLSQSQRRADQTRMKGLIRRPNKPFMRHDLSAGSAGSTMESSSAS